MQLASLVAAGLSLILVIKRLSRPPVGTLARDTPSGALGRSDRHPAWPAVPGVLVVRADVPLFYANAVAVKDLVLALARQTDPRPHTVVLDLGQSPDLDVETLDAAASWPTRSTPSAPRSGSPRCARRR
jgi:sulfate permease, SulP family